MKRLLAVLLLTTPASAHDAWINGEPIPSWVRSSCCGPSDAHHIPASAVRVMPDGYHIDGINTVVPIDRALPSQDGAIWGFWLPTAEPNPTIYCFFFPTNGT